MSYFTEYPSPIGKLTIASDGNNITGLWIEGQKYFMSTLDMDLERNDNLPIFGRAVEWLGRYFAGKKPLPEELPLMPKGSEFRQTIWKCLCRIPYGKTICYSEIAKEISVLYARSGISAQAVGGAVGHNPISIIIPCHRVVGKNGNLTGYAGGVNKKLWLLRHEGVDTDRLF